MGEGTKLFCYYDLPQNCRKYSKQRDVTAKKISEDADINPVSAGSSSHVYCYNPHRKLTVSMRMRWNSSIVNETSS